MFGEVANALKTTGCYTDGEIELFQREVKMRTLEKGEVLLHEGAIETSVYFLVEGAMYQCIPDREENCKIVAMHLANEWLLNADSFISQRPSNRKIVAFSQSAFLALPIASVHHLMRKSVSFLQLNSVLTGQCSNADFLNHGLSPIEKYQYITKHRPDLLQKFPLKMIASYLNISPETLSRVRNKLVKSTY